MTLNKEWMKIQNRADKEYIDGVDQFLEWAFTCEGTRKRIRCPCNRCRNTEFYNRTEVRFHLFNKGFYNGYKFWTHHGEKREAEPEDDGEEQQNKSHDELNELIQDLQYGHTDANVRDTTSTNLDSLDMHDVPNFEASKFYNLIEDAKQKLYEGCDDDVTKFSFLVKLLHQKCLNKWTDKSMDGLLKNQKEILPKGALVPDSYYDAKKIIKELGLDYIKIDACLNDCVLYWKENENAEVCPTCGESRWKVVNQEKELSTTNKIHKKEPHKVLRYFPITQRLQRLYMSRKTAKDMRWHKEVNVDSGLMKHPADSLAWKSFDNIYPAFASDPRSIRFGLASDGFNPFGNMSTSYSIWPVVLVPYNLPPWLCMKQSYFMMALLIPGRSSPGNDIDVYLQPLIEELNHLWEVGVDAYDAHARQNFNLRAAVLWTINDFPAYGNLSGWVTKGKLACPCCHNEASYYSLRSKIGYMGHRIYLPANHKWRNETKAFDGKKEHRFAPKPLSGDDVLKQLEKLEPVKFGKKSKRKKDVSNWSKKSIFFELPYWKSLLIRHNLDVMHIERNVSDSILSTLMGTNGKTKDTLKARCDLVDMGIRRELHPYKEREKWRLPNAIYNLSPTEKTKLCDFLKDLKVPDGFASNISRCVNVKERKVYGMKCHDHHIFLQRILPFIAKGLLKNEICEPLIELSIFFSELCSKVLDPSKLDELDTKIAITLCKLEKVFPPAFFDVMIHLPIHLVREAKIAGPVQFRWMYPIERYLRTLKSYVRNNARPEGSIAEGYIVDECLTFCSRYINTMDTKFNRLPRNDDSFDAKQSNLSIFKRNGQAKGSSKAIHLSMDDYNESRMYILQNCDEVLPFIEQHKSQLVGRNEKEIITKHKAEFPHWFYSQVSKLYEKGQVDIDLYNLAIGPEKLVHRYDSYIVNGFRFHTNARELHLKCQNSGVLVKGDVSAQLQEYYGVLMDIYKFSFVGGNEVFVFKCHWWDVGSKGMGYKIDKWGYTYVNSSRSLKTNENFVLAVQAEQVYYVKDMMDPQWLVVNKHSPRDVYFNPSSLVHDDLREDTGPDDGEAYQNALIINHIISDDIGVDINTSGVLYRNDFEGRIVDERLEDDCEEDFEKDDASFYSDEEDDVNLDIHIGEDDDD